MSQRQLGVRVEYADAPILIEQIDALCGTHGDVIPINLKELLNSCRYNLKNVLLGLSEEVMDEYVERASDIHGKDGECEVDSDAIISVSSDNGAYVSAWVWVYNSDLWTEDKRKNLVATMTPGQEVHVGGHTIVKHNKDGKIVYRIDGDEDRDLDSLDDAIDFCLEDE